MNECRGSLQGCASSSALPTSSDSDFTGSSESLATKAIAMVFPSTQSCHLEPSLSGMPTEVKRLIVRALLDLEPSALVVIPEEEALGWLDDSHWSHQTSGRRGYAKQRRWKRLGALMAVDREFEQLAAEWTWNYYEFKFPDRRWSSAHAAPLPPAPRLGQYIRSIILRTHNSGGSFVVFCAAIIPTLPHLEDVDMDPPKVPNWFDGINMDSLKTLEDDDVFGVVATVARVGMQIRRLCLAPGYYSESDSIRRAVQQESSWFAKYLREFPFLTVLEMYEIDRGGAVKLAATLASLSNLTTLHLNHVRGIPSPDTLLIPFTAPIRILHVTYADPLDDWYPGQNVLESWLSGFGPALEILVYDEQDSPHPPLDPRLSAPSPILTLPNLTSLSLSTNRTATNLYDAFAHSPIKNFVIHGSKHMSLDSLKNFISSHSTIEKVLTQGLFSLSKVEDDDIGALCEARGITLKREHVVDYYGMIESLILQRRQNRG